MAHGHIDHGPASIQGHSRKNDLIAGIALKFPYQMVPGVCRWGRAGRSGGAPAVGRGVPNSPGMVSLHIALGGKLVAVCASALAHAKLQGLGRRRIVHVERKLIDKMSGAVVRGQIFPPQCLPPGGGPAEQGKLRRPATERRAAYADRLGVNRSRAPSTGGAILPVWDLLDIVQCGCITRYRGLRTARIADVIAAGASRAAG